MKPLRGCTSGNLEWRQVSTRPREFELTSDSAVYGLLRWPATCSPLAIGEAASGRWTFNRDGLLRRRITARRAQEEADAAVYSPRFRGGILEVEGGQLYVWTRKGPWAPRWTLRPANGRPLVQFDRIRGFSELAARVEVREDARSLDTTSLLILMGWYLIVLDNEDAEMAAITTVLMGGAS